MTPAERPRTSQAGRLKPGSQNARIVAALDGSGWMTTAEIHRAAGFSRLNSRIAELRDHGYVIPSRHVEGKVGPHGTEYFLAATPGAESPQRVEHSPLGTVGAAEVAGPVPLSAPGTEANGATDGPPSVSSVPAQLSLEVAA